MTLIIHESINGLDDEKAIVVLIEWDAKRVPSTYYRRMEVLGFKVAGDKELPPLLRRANDNITGGVIFQEGAIIVPSMSSARFIYWLALEHGAKNVLIGNLNIIEKMTRSRSDAAIIDRIERIYSKRGKKPSAVDWAISCSECLEVTHSVAWAVPNCPNCGGFFIHLRQGTPRQFSDDGRDIVDLWVATRFSGSHWEPVGLHQDAPVPPTAVSCDIGNAQEETTIVRIRRSGSLIAQLDQMPRETALSFLDAILMSLTRRTRNDRMESRAHIAADFFQKGGSPLQMSMLEPTEKQDIDLSLAGPTLSSSAITSWLLRLSN